MNRPTFIEVILPLALPKLYTYAVHFEEAEKIQVGQRIIVQFGRRRIYSAIVSRIHHKKPKEYDPKFVEEIIDESPIVTLHQLQLWQWIAQYYMCTIGEVMAIALPSALKLSSESIFLYNEGADIQNIELSDDEYLIAEALEMNRELKLDDIQGILGKKNVHPIAQSLMEKRICVVKEVVLQKYKEKTVSFVALSERYSTDKALQALFDKLGKKEKQIAVLLYYLQLTPERILIEKKKLTANPTISDSSIKTLIKNEIFVEKRQTVSRLMAKNVEVKSLDNLSPAQQKALNETQAIFTEKNVAVLEGVTGSGKTHIYIKLIKEAIAKGEQVLYLLPEIALTAQIVMRLAKYFGKKVGIYHSKFNDQERVEIYQKVLKDEYKIILAARSGVFLPFQNLGLIIVDEEHERSYKQYEPAPRYHARDTAVMMSRFYDAKVLLGSATLSLETYNNVQQEKYGHVLLSERFGDAVLPEITLLDTVDLTRRKKMNGLFSDPMKKAIETALSNKEQIILFQNRRGFANFLYCNTCAWVPQCKSCDVSLTYHKHFNALICHYCGYQENMPSNCRACGSADTTVKGVGTEQIEDEIKLTFPEAKTARLDLDTTRKKHGHEEIIFAFQRQEVDILIGTQMVTKGLDFGNVSLVGVINADQLISIPEFRAGERAFQLLAQVSGRAGRKSTPGKVIVQTGNPQHPIFQLVKDYRFTDFYYSEMLTRQQFHYPPFYNLIQITVKHRLPDAVRDAASLLGKSLRQILSNRVLGPTTPPVSRVRNQYIKHIIIKIERNSQSVVKTKQTLAQQIEICQRQYKAVRFVIDVDA